MVKTMETIASQLALTPIVVTTSRNIHLPYVSIDRYNADT